MGVQYTACLRLSEAVGQAARLRAFLADMRLRFDGSNWELSIADGDVVYHESGSLSESDYFEQCWQQGSSRVAEFVAQDFFVQLGTVEAFGSRYVFLSVTERSLGRLASHLEEQDSGFWGFISNLESCLGVEASVLGKDVSKGHLIDFLRARLGPKEIDRFILGAGNPSEDNLEILISLDFEERMTAGRLYYRREWPELENWQEPDL